MVMRACATFDYVGSVPAAGAIGLQMPLRLRTPAPLTGNPGWDERLLGPVVTLTIEPGTSSTEAVSLVLRRPPASPFSRCLRWLRRSDHVAAEASFEVDGNVAFAWQPGDRIQFLRDQANRLAFGLCRRGATVLALGDVTLLDLGSGLDLYWELPVWVRTMLSPEELASLGGRRIATAGDLEGEQADPRPLIVTIGGERASLTAGQTCRFGSQHVHVVRSFDPNGIPIRKRGAVALWQDGLIPARAAIASAPLEPFAVNYR